MPDYHGIVAVLVPSIHGGNLVIHVHRHRERNRRGGRRGARRILGQHHGKIVKEHVPGHLAHNAVHFQAILFLERLHRHQGIAQEVSAHRAGIVAQLRQAVLQGFHPRPRGTPRQVALKGHLLQHGSQGLRRGALVHQKAGIRRRGGGSRGRAVIFPHGLPAVHQRLGIHIRNARSFQAIAFLEFAHGGLAAFQIIAADFAGKIPQLRETGLQFLHVIPGGTVLQGTVLGAEQKRLGVRVHHAGGFQSKVLLKGFHRRLGTFAKVPTDISRIVIQLRQPPLQLRYPIARIAKLQVRRLEFFLDERHFFFAGGVILQNDLSLAQRRARAKQHEERQE